MKAVKKDITLGHIGKPNEEIKDAIVFELEEEDYSKAIKGLKTLEQKRIEKLEQENKQLKEQLEEIRKSQKITFETLLLTDKALELACEDIKGTGLFAITDEFESFEDVYIKSAEQKLNKDN